MSLIASQKFLPLQQLPQFETVTLLREVFADLWSRKASGFVLGESGRPRNYVKATKLADWIVKVANGNREVLGSYCSKPIGQVVDALPDGEKSLLVPVESNPFPPGTSESMLQTRSNAAFCIVENQRQIGWYLNHEDVRIAATKRIVFICSNAHRNPDPDHGSCYKCPADIVSTATE